MENILKDTLLFDFYSELLTEKQKTAYLFYYFEDLSLMEIAEHFKISRQAVRDLIVRTNNILIGYEEKLKLMEKHINNQKKIAKIKNIIHGHPNENIKTEVTVLLDSLLD